MEIIRNYFDDIGILVNFIEVVLILLAFFGITRFTQIKRLLQDWTLFAIFYSLFSGILMAILLCFVLNLSGSGLFIFTAFTMQFFIFIAIKTAEIIITKVKVQVGIAAAFIAAMIIMCSGIIMSIAISVILFGHTSIMFHGNVDYNIKGASIELKVENIINNQGKKTGNLRLRLWATKNPFEGGRMKGYVIASHQLGSLASKSRYSNIEQTVDFVSLLKGWHYITMTLEEYKMRKSKWDMRDYITFRVKECVNCIE